LSNTRVSIDPTTGQTLVDGQPVDLDALPSEDRDTVLSEIIAKRDSYLRSERDIQDMRESARSDYEGMPLQERWGGVIKSGLETLASAGKVAGNYLDTTLFGGEPVVGTLFGTIEAGNAARMGEDAKGAAALTDVSIGLMDDGPWKAGAKGLLSMEEMGRAGAAGDGWGVTSNAAKMFSAGSELVEAAPLARGFDGLANAVDAAKSINEGVEAYDEIGERDEYMEGLDAGSAGRQAEMGGRAMDYDAALRDAIGPDIDPSTLPFNFLDSLPGVGQPFADPPMFTPVDGEGSLGLEASPGGGRYIASLDLPQPVDIGGDGGMAEPDGYGGLDADPGGPADLGAPLGLSLYDGGGDMPGDPGASLDVSLGEGPGPGPGADSAYFGESSALPMADSYEPSAPTLSSYEPIPDPEPSGSDYGGYEPGPSLPVSDYDGGAGLDLPEPAYTAPEPIYAMPEPVSYEPPEPTISMPEPAAYTPPEPPSLSDIASGGDIGGSDLSGGDIGGGDASGGE
jgi:hypothetical protein